ncbi:MAG: caspase family protein [Bacteroidales bacterium]|nr:caspase family protein [Bacteroidales bacterium]
MQRRLLLLCNPGYEECGNYVPQAIKIIEAYKQYFQSSVGGVWCDDEIDEMPKHLIGMGQNYWLAKKIEQYDKLDYSIIVFIGHGGSFDNSDYIQLSGGKVFAIKDLYRNENTIKRTIIIDSCRSYIEPNIFNLLLETLEKNTEDCRYLYDEIIKDAELHCELLQSTQYGELAKTTETGSVFSDAFFNVLKKNISLWKTEALSNPEKQVVKTIQDILDPIRTEMSIYGQVPQYTSKSHSHFPIFAVKRESVLI